jgi:DNA processing protein
MDSTPTDEAAACCALLRAPGVGGATLDPLLREHAATDILAGRVPGLRGELRDYLEHPDEAGVAADMRWLEQPDCHLLRRNDPDYPRLLAELPSPPPVLFLRGDPDLLQLPQLAIVGSRHPTAGGRATAIDFAGHLAARGLVISSGLALGIDAAAHQGALEADGLTLAVTGTGPDRIYPAQHRALAHRIAEQGLLVSEFPTGTPPLPANFPRRNRILAGLALGTLVVEAALKSGSLITARLAAEAGREVFAIPGSIHNPLARGCHALIRSGAKLVESGDDVLEELAPLVRLPTAAPRAESTDTAASQALEHDHQAVLEAMGHDPVTTDQLVERTGFSAAEVSSILLLLELQGHVSSDAGGVFARLARCVE